MSVDIHARLTSAIHSFLGDSLTGASLTDFAESWESLYSEAVEDRSAKPLDDGDALPYDIADAIGVMCESLMGLEIFETKETDRLQDEHNGVKMQLVTQTLQRSVKAPSPAPSSSPSPSRDSSPTSPSRSREPTPRRSMSPHSTPPVVRAASRCIEAIDLALAATPLDASRSASPLPDIDSERRVIKDTDPDVTEQVSASVGLKDAPVTVIEEEEEAAEPSPVTNFQVLAESGLCRRSKEPSTVTPTYIRPLLTHLVGKPYNLYPSKTLISEIALSTASSEKDINAYLSQLRSKLGWNGIRKTYFPPTQWSSNEMLAWLDGYWRYTHSELPSLKDYDIYMGANGISGTMRGLDVQLAILYDDLKGIYERMTGREGEGSDVGKAIKEGVKWSGKEEWERKRKELEKQGEALRKAQREEERGLKRKFVDDEDYDGEEEARQVPRARVVSAPQPQSKKRGRSESPESEDDGDSTPPPPAKRHCSLPTMSLSTPPDLENWFKIETPTWTLDAPVTLKAFSYDTVPMPSLVDDDSDSERGSSVGPSTPDSAEHVDLPSFDFSNLMQPTEYGGGIPKPSELYVPTLPDVAFPELLNAQTLNIDLFAGLSAAPPVASTGKDLSSLSSSDQFISIPTSDEAPFDFGDPQSWSFNYEDLDLGSLGFDLNFAVDGV